MGPLVKEEDQPLGLPGKRTRRRPRPWGLVSTPAVLLALACGVTAHGSSGAFVSVSATWGPQQPQEDGRRGRLVVSRQSSMQGQDAGGERRPGGGLSNFPPRLVPPPIPHAAGGFGLPPPMPPPPSFNPIARAFGVGGATMDRPRASPQRQASPQQQQPPQQQPPVYPMAPAWAQPMRQLPPSSSPNDGWMAAPARSRGQAPVVPPRTWSPQQPPRARALPPTPMQAAPPLPPSNNRCVAGTHPKRAAGPQRPAEQPPQPPPQRAAPPAPRPAARRSATPCLPPSTTAEQQQQQQQPQQQPQSNTARRRQGQASVAPSPTPGLALVAPVEFDGQGRRLAPQQQQQQQQQVAFTVPAPTQRRRAASAPASEPMPVQTDAPAAGPAPAPRRPVQQEQQPPPQRSDRAAQRAERSRWDAVAPPQGQQAGVPQELVELRGVVKRITFAAADSGFTVLKVEREEHKDLVTVVGSFPPTNVGAAVAVRGEWVADARWGRQLRAVEYNETAPATQEGIENYLASGLVRGIGPVAAAQIVGYFGAATLDVLNEAPERLVEVEGIGPKKARMIEQAWRGQREVTAVMLFLQSHNVTTALATRIYKKYGNASVEVLHRDPYQLADEMEGIGFRTVDKIAAQLGFDPASPTRYRSGLLFLLREQANEGHCFGSRAGLLREGCKLLGTEPELLEPVLDRMVAAGDVVAHGPAGQPQQQALFLPFFDMCETQTAYRIQALMAQPPDALRAAIADDEAKFAATVKRAEKARGVAFDEGQLRGLRAAARGRCTVVTGGPGTGKTTMALAIISMFQGVGAKVMLCAPTGRAAQRLGEGAGLEAKTIHRLLEYSSESKGFGRGPGNLLECDALVVDEASMVDVVLMHHLLAALPTRASVVLVGDVDQLPPVGPGNVLRDMIDSGVVEVVRLQTIFRQAERSAIVTNAHRINRGELPDLDGGGAKASSDFFLLEEEDPSKVVELITDLCTRRLPQRYGVDPLADVQVLCPVKKGEAGTLHLNTVLQRALNPVQPQQQGKCGGAVRYGGREFRVGDKVMQVKNNYEKSVFNGGMGTIVSADPAAKTLGVRFDGLAETVAYDATELDQIMLAYAATVHKSQGSEYRVVVAPLLLRQHQPMLQRNLLYTCVTRARELLVLVGSRQAIARAVANDKPAARNSLLHRRLVTAKGKPLFGENEGSNDGDGALAEGHGAGDQRQKERRRRTTD